MHENPWTKQGNPWIPGHTLKIGQIPGRLATMNTPPPHFLSKVTGRFKRSWTLPRFINANCYKFENSLLVAANKCTHERNIVQYQKQ